MSLTYMWWRSLEYHSLVRFVVYKMLHKVVFLCLVVMAAAAPPTDVVPLEKQQPTVIPIVSQSEELEPNGTYKFSYETGNGIKREETSYDKVVPRAQARSAASDEGGESDSDEIHVQQGSYSYTAPDGTVISVRYIADENGFQPIGDHIPKVLSIVPSSNSAEKSGRALKVEDSADAASAPAIVARSGAPEKPAAEEQSENKEVTEVAKAKSTEEATTPEVQNAEVASAPEAVSAESDVTTKAATEVTTEALTNEAASTPEDSSNDSSTAASDSSTTEAPSSEAASSSEAVSTTEAGTTIAA